MAATLATDPAWHSAADEAEFTCDSINNKRILITLGLSKICKK
jgi:hypothetical protein